MASKAFADVNLLLDFTAIDGTIIMYTTPAIVRTVAYWIAKVYGNAKAKELLLTLMADVTVIDLPHEIVLNALHSKINDIKDALQYYTAIHHKLDYFISRDKLLQKQSIPILPVYTPRGFLNEVS